MSLTVLMLVMSAFTHLSKPLATSSPHDAYLNARFSNGNCYHEQSSSNSCVSASIQMIFDYYEYCPLPNQTELASEMQTDLEHTTQWCYASIPFEMRGFHEFRNQSLSDNFATALSVLKDNTFKNFPAMVNTWFDEEEKIRGIITHARLIIGYNSTGIFYDDPWSGPNQFMANDLLEDLWDTGLGYWAFIVEREPLFTLTVQAEDLLGSSIPGLELSLTGAANQTAATDLNGTARFFNLTMGTYALRYDWRLQSDKIAFSLEGSVNQSLTFVLSNQIIMIGILILVVIVLAVILIHQSEKLHLKSASRMVGRITHQ